MGFFDFVKHAGEKLFGAKEAEEASAAVASAPDDDAAKARLDELNREAGAAIESYVNTQGLSVTGLTVTFDGSTGVGVGLKSARPIYCKTEGVAYWTTDENVLYRWHNGNWELYYIPYTYPHPLRTAFGD